jgi:uncharacterized membrane protein
MKVLNHLLVPDLVLPRRFPAPVLSEIEAAIKASETRHRAEIRFAIEAALDLRSLWRVRAPRERALEVFAELEVWNTAERNGVLIYALLAERSVDIVADCGFDGRVTTAEWRGVCELIEASFRDACWSRGALAGIDAVSRLLEREFPANGPNADEQVNRPTLL